MLFNSNIFLFVFLPLALTGYYLFRRLGGIQTGFWWIFASSLVFYSYWSPKYIILILGSIVLNFFIGKVLYRSRLKWVLVLGIVFNLSLLGVYKYLGFFVESMNWAFDSSLWVPKIALPIGISFFTFQQIAFLVDMYREQMQEPRFSHYGVFVSFFPQLIAGPIVHHKEMMPQFRDLPMQSKLLENFSLGLTLFVMGLSKKVLIADKLSSQAGLTFNAAADGTVPHFLDAWTGVLAYTFQIYFDFSGYSDMAVGLGLLFGIRLPANFLSPYKSLNIIEFWRRWHITLSRFLRDYLYFPLGGGRRGKVRRYVNLVTVMLLGGLWHGAGWTFVLWGGLHGMYLIVAHAWALLPRPTDNRIYRVAAASITFLAVVVAWVTFRAETFPAAVKVYQGMIGLGGFTLPADVATVLKGVGLGPLVEGIGVYYPASRVALFLGWIWIILAALIAFFLPNSIELTRRFRPIVDMEKLNEKGLDKSMFRELHWKPTPLMAVVIGFLLVSVIVTLNTVAESEFLYFQF